MRRALHVVLWAGLLAGAGPLPSSAISERIVHDRYTGLAIAGYDPVAYFLEGRAVAGLPEHEVAWGGGYWRFVNAGNAAAFSDAPQVYAPAYGGHGVAGIARGVAQPGDPTVFAVYRGRLFLFFDTADLAAFRAQPDPFVAAADARWPEVERRLAN